MNRIKFIVNPRSGEKKTLVFLRKLKYYCNYYNLDYSISLTKDKHHGTEMADEAMHQGFDIIVAVGGDGTLHEVLQGIVGKDLTLGVIPFGSSNDFARTVKIPKDIKEAVRIIAKGKVKKIDVGAVNDRFFINISSAGFDGEVVARLPKMRSKYLFSLVYILGVFKELFRYKKKNVKVIKDGEDLGDYKVNLVAVANGKFYGHNMKIAPKAKLDDGFFDVILIADFNPIRFISNFPKVFKGTHIYNKDVILFRCKEITLFSKERVFIQSDGELTGKLPVEYRIFPKFQKLIVPESEM
ncbi:MAG: diacylglycerol kinase family lipid kinase [bacterium]|nr:diacylglycerol kinase family lipid kinase [bacterium]